MNDFINHVVPENCTPLDLKYFPVFFPGLFTFATRLHDIKRGCIIKTNFYGAPRWGHAMLVTSDGVFYTIIRKNNDRYLCLSFNVVTMTGNGECIFQIFSVVQEKMDDMKDYSSFKHRFETTVKNEFEKVDPKKRVFLMNPTEEVDKKKFSDSISPYSNEKLQYDTYKAVTSAFQSCTKKASMSSYITGSYKSQIEGFGVAFDKPFFVHCTKWKEF